MFLFLKKIMSKDKVLGESPHQHTGHHGGLSEDEMYVPVIIIEA